jgi:hypothetical protein
MRFAADRDAPGALDVGRARAVFSRPRGVLAGPAAAVLVMTLGALPVLAVLVAAAMPPPRR